MSETLHNGGLGLKSSSIPAQFLPTSKHAIIFLNRTENSFMETNKIANQIYRLQVDYKSVKGEGNRVCGLVVRVPGC